MLAREKENFQNGLRVLVQNELIERCRRNPLYSMRAFAKDMSISRSVLSDIINGKRNPGKKTSSRICEHLGLNDEDIQLFKETSFGETGTAYQRIDFDKFNMIADWYHYAILELLNIKNFDFNVRGISRVLDLNELTIKLALDRLERLDLLKRDSAGRYIDGTNGFSTNMSQEQVCRAGKMQQLQLLEKSMDTLNNVCSDLRSHTSATVSINIKDLPKARNIIKRFRRELAEVLDSAETKNEVYNLSIQLFPLSNVRGGGQLEN